MAKSKKVDAAKAKAARQKKMAIGLGVLFVVLLGIQVPRTMKMLEGPPQAAPAPTPVASTTAAGTPPPPGTPGAATTPAPAQPAGAAPEQPAVLADTDIAPQGGEGQLLSFERFESKDPFRQQAGVTETPADGAAEEPSAENGSPDEEAPEAEPEPETESPSGGETGGVVPGAPSAPAPTNPPPTTPAPTAPAPPAAPAAATTISVDGRSETVEVDRPFPADDPTFVLVSVARDGKSVRIGVAGGEYADGRATVELRLGKPLTLRNTADGTRFRLELLTVAGFVPPAG